MKNELKSVITVLTVILLSGFVGFNILNDNDDSSYVDLNKKENITEVNTEEFLEIGVSAMLSPKETLSVYYEIIDYIGEKLGKKTKLVQRQTYAEMNELIKNREVVAAFVCSGPYVEGHDEFGMELIVTPQMYNNTVYYSYIIVHKENEIKSFEDLKGKKFAFTDPKSNTGKLVPTYVLSKMNETPDSFFEEYIFSGSHDNSISAVDDKLVDGAAVDHLIWEYINKTSPELTSSTKVIEKHGPYAIPPFVTHPDTDPVLKERLRSILLDMDKDEKGKKIIEQIGIEKFLLIDDASYDSVREMILWEASKG